MSIIRNVRLALLSLAILGCNLILAVNVEAQQKLSRSEIVIARPVTVLIHGAAVDASLRM